MVKNSAASRLVLGAYSEAAVIAAARDALREIGGVVTCAFVFVSADFLPHLSDFLELIQLHGHVPLLIGCSASGLIGDRIEAEQSSGFSFQFLRMPGTTVTSFEFSQEDVDESTNEAAWHKLTGIAPDEVDAWAVLAQPMEISVERWLGGWNKAYPKVPCLGGLASSATEDMFVFRNREVVKGGGVAISFKGGARLIPVVSQGCTPIGTPLAVTSVARNTLVSLGNRPAYEVLAGAFESLSEDEKRRSQGNLFAGIATSEYLDEIKRGDFLIRNIIGADAESGLVTVAAYPRVGQTLQYQLRDKRSAAEISGPAWKQQRSMEQNRLPLCCLPATAGANTFLARRTMTRRNWRGTSLPCLWLVCFVTAKSAR